MTNGGCLHIALLNNLQTDAVNTSPQLLSSQHGAVYMQLQVSKIMQVSYYGDIV